MKIVKWEQLPKEMQIEEVKRYYDILKHKKRSLFFKRVFDVVFSLLLLCILIPVFLLLALAIKIDSPGPVFYRQVRVTQYNEKFRIFKFRSMVQNADQGPLVTVSADTRITRVGKIVRKFRIDEFPQLIDVLRGKMTFVGTRPEVPKYTAQYTPEMMATLLLPAGITNLASIYYKDEAKLLDSRDDVDRAYVETVLPAKMYYNLKAIENYSFFGELKIMLMTFLAVLGKENKCEYEVAASRDSKEETCGEAKL